MSEKRVRIVHDRDVQVWGWLLNCNGPADDVMVYIPDTMSKHEGPLDAITYSPNNRRLRKAILEALGVSRFQDIDSVQEYSYKSWDEWLRDYWLDKYLLSYSEWLEAAVDAGLVIAVDMSTAYSYAILWTLPESGISEDIVRDYRRYVEDVLDGNIYGYIIEEGTQCDQGHTHWDEVDSCWGFVGGDVGSNGMLDNIPKELHEMARNATN